MEFRYMSSSFNDLVKSKGWFGKVLLLAAVQFIPVYGWLLLYGYAFKWAREIAWCVRAPLPPHVFTNDDHMYKRGFHTLLISVAYVIIPAMIYYVGEGMYYGTLTVTSAGVELAGGGGFLAMLVMAIGVCAWVFAAMLANVGCMRSAIYGRLGPGFRLGTIWKMFKHDKRGFFKVMGMSVLLGAATSVILVIFLYVVVFSFIMMGIMTSVYVADVGITDISAFISSFSISAFACIAIVSFVSFALDAVVLLLVARATGYWTSQFAVPQWRTNADPLPFEIAGQQYAQPMR